eukprot:PhM_4_TR7730/c0_g1_i1/m.37948
MPRYTLHILPGTDDVPSLSPDACAAFYLVGALCTTSADVSVVPSPDPEPRLVLEDTQSGHYKRDNFRGFDAICSHLTSAYDRPMNAKDSMIVSSTRAVFGSALMMLLYGHPKTYDAVVQRTANANLPVLRRIFDNSRGYRVTALRVAAEGGVSNEQDAVRAIYTFLTDVNVMLATSKFLGGDVEGVSSSPIVDLVVAAHVAVLQAVPWQQLPVPGADNDDLRLYVRRVSESVRLEKFWKPVEPFDTTGRWSLVLSVMSFCGIYLVLTNIDLIELILQNKSNDGGDGGSGDHVTSDEKEGQNESKAASE